MKKLIIAIILVLLSVSAVNAEPSFIDNRNSNNSRTDQYLENNLRSRCVSQGVSPQQQTPYCQNSWDGQGRARLVPIGYDSRTGLLIMKPVYD